MIHSSSLESLEGFTDRRGYVELSKANSEVCCFATARYKIDEVVELPTETAHVTLDIKPGRDTNPVNLKSNGNLPVAIYGMDDFDVEAIDVDTIAFGDLPLVEAGATPVGPTLYSYGDISGDGIADLSLKFSMRDIKDHAVFDDATMEAGTDGLTV